MKSAASSTKIKYPRQNISSWNVLHSDCTHNYPLEGFSYCVWSKLQLATHVDVTINPYLNREHGSVSHDEWLDLEGFAEGRCLVHSSHSSSLVSIDVLP